MILYNSLSKEKQSLQPVKEGVVSIYCCGMTVYDHCHIGHARSWVIFEALRRYLQVLGYKVILVRNITDIDDKIIARANKHGKSAQDWAQIYIDSMQADETALGLQAPDHEPRATDYLEQMIQLITLLIDHNKAYVADNGDVCFAVREYPAYGELSKRSVDQMRSGARIDIEHGKNDPLDFVLWKKSKPGEPSWSSPWGEGRPGWHIECSAMSSELLGQPFDIHGGGMDLKFPHHENEIAQSQAACDKVFANTWMHVGLVQVNNEKMSKSLGNFMTLKALLKQYHPEVLRYFLLSAHYRRPLQYSDELLQQSKASLMRLYQALSEVEPLENDSMAECQQYLETFQKALNDDFNTPEALAVLFDCARAINRYKAKDNTLASNCAFCLRNMAQMLGLLQLQPESFLEQGYDDLDVDAIEQLVAQRAKARADKNWQLADELRDKLSDMGIVCEDKSSGRNWRRVS